MDESWQKSQVWLDRLQGAAWGFKVGSILYAERGPQIIEELLRRGYKVFLDLKFHDIPNTVQGAVRQAFQNGVHFLTVHACGGAKMLELAAAEQRPDQIVLAVTVLTSFEENDLEMVGVGGGLDQQVVRLAHLAVKAGIRGLVCSPLEVRSLRQQWPQMALVTPGVRLDKNVQDQKRTLSPAEAFQQGASHIVLGRALTASSNWEQTWNQITSSLGAMS